MTRRPQDPLEERLSHLAHEFRSPLSGIQSLVSLLQESPDNLTSIQRDQVRLIGAFTDHLEAMVLNILRHAQFDRGTHLLHEEFIDVGSLVQDILKLKAFAFTTHQVEVVVQKEEGLPLLKADRTLLTQVILNLLDNALKFTPAHGRVILDLYFTDEGFRLTVSDSGPGMNMLYHALAVKPYTQLHKGEGLGLGLSLVKMTMELHQGTVHLDNHPKGGLVVTLRFGPERCGSGVSLAQNDL